MTVAEAIASAEGHDLHVYWCPRCRVQTRTSFHTVGRPGLFPQTQEEHDCVRIPVTPLPPPDVT